MKLSSLIFISKALGNKMPMFYDFIAVPDEGGKESVRGLKNVVESLM